MRVRSGGPKVDSAGAYVISKPGGRDGRAMGVAEIVAILGQFGAETPSDPKSSGATRGPFEARVLVLNISAEPRDALWSRANRACARNPPRAKIPTAQH